MSEWPKQNDEAHLPQDGDQAPECLDCETLCCESMPCRCCLAAEVETLRATAEAVRKAVGDERYNPYPNTGSFDDGYNACREDVLDALDEPEVDS